MGLKMRDLHISLDNGILTKYQVFTETVNRGDRHPKERRREGESCLNNDLETMRMYWRAGGFLIKMRSNLMFCNK